MLKLDSEDRKVLGVLAVRAVSVILAVLLAALTLGAAVRLFDVVAGL